MLKASRFSHGWNSIKTALLHKRSFAAIVMAACLILPGAALAMQASLPTSDSLDNRPASETQASHESSSSTTEINSNITDHGTDQKQSSESTISVTVPPTSTNNSSEASVTVNGQDVPIPDSGHVQKQIDSPGSKTQVDVNIDNSTSTSNSSSTSISIDSYSSSSRNDASDRGGRTAPHR